MSARLRFPRARWLLRLLRLGPVRAHQPHVLCSSLLQLPLAPILAAATPICPSPSSQDSGMAQDEDLAMLGLSSLSNCLGDLRSAHRQLLQAIRSTSGDGALPLVRARAAPPDGICPSGPALHALSTAAHGVCGDSTHPQQRTACNTRRAAAGRRCTWRWWPACGPCSRCCIVRRAMKTGCTRAWPMTLRGACSGCVLRQQQQW